MLLFTSMQTRKLQISGGVDGFSILLKNNSSCFISKSYSSSCSRAIFRVFNFYSSWNIFKRDLCMIWLCNVVFQIRWWFVHTVAKITWMHRFSSASRSCSSCFLYLFLWNEITRKWKFTKMLQETHIEGVIVQYIWQ